MGRGSGWQHSATAAFGEEEAGGQGGCGWTRKRGERGGDEDPATASRRRKRRRRRRKRPSVVNMLKRERSSTVTIAASERLLRPRKWRRSMRQPWRENQGDVDQFLAAIDGDGEDGRREREQGRKVVKDGYGVGKEIKGRDLGGRRTEAKEEKRGGGQRSWRERDGVDTSRGGWRCRRGRRGFRQGSKQRRRRNGGGAGAQKGNRRRRKTKLGLGFFHFNKPNLRLDKLD